MSDDETSTLLLKTPWMTMNTSTTSRRRNENDDYSSIASSATVASTAISSSSSSSCENINEQLSPQSAKDDDDFQIMDIDEAMDRLGMGLFQFQIVLACGLCFASDAMEYLLLSYLAVILESRWNLTLVESYSISSVVFFGALVGTLVLGPLGDSVGRRIVFGVTSSTISFFGIFTAFCTNYPQILVVRFLVGFGIGGLTVPYDTLREFMPNSRRGKNMLFTSFFWISASLMVPVFAWLTVGSTTSNEGSFDSWRAFVLLCSLPSVVSTGLGLWFVPESPRWLLTRGKHERALSILRTAAAKNGVEPYLAFPEGTRLVESRTVIQDTTSNNSMGTNHHQMPRSGDGIQRDTASTTNEESDRLKFHYSEESSNSEAIACERICNMCENPQWQKISFCLGIQWYGLTFMYYGAIMAISIVFSNIQIDQSDGDNDDDDGGTFDFDYWDILKASSAEIVGLTLAIVLVDRVGRVPTQVWGYSLGGLSLLLLGILDYNSIQSASEEASPKNHLIVFAFLSRMFIMGATAITWLHTAELLPTRFRATGHGLANAMGRIGGMTCPFIVSRDNSLRTIGIVMFSVGLVTALSVRQLPETLGKALGNFGVDLSSSEPPQQAQSSQPASLETLQGSYNTTTINGRGTAPSSYSTHGVAETTTTPTTGENKLDAHQQQPKDQTDEEEADKRLISSFEIL